MTLVIDEDSEKGLVNKASFSFSSYLDDLRALKREIVGNLKNPKNLQ